MKIRFWPVVAAAALSLCVSSPALAASDLLRLPAQESPLASTSLLLDVATAGERLVAVGERGHIVYSDDGGATWEQANVPVSVTLTALSFPADKNGWAVGHDGVVLGSADGGATWQVMVNGDDLGRAQLKTMEAKKAKLEAQLAAATGAEKEDLTWALEDMDYFMGDIQADLEDGPWKPLLDVSFADEQNGIVIGAYGMIFTTSDGGASWSSIGDRLENPDGFHYNAICRAGGDLFIAGEMGTLYASADAGASWETLASPYEGSFFGVACAADASIVAAMGLKGNVFISRDKGQSWERLDTNTRFPIYGGAVTAGGKLLLASKKLIKADPESGAVQEIQAPAAAYSAVTTAADSAFVAVGSGGAIRLEPKAQGDK